MKPNSEEKIDVDAKCKFTPMEFETIKHPERISENLSVNLLRWSLKRILFDMLTENVKGVNLLRWSLKLTSNEETKKAVECKFTPMEFETLKSQTIQKFLTLC